jgi:hypothetical protein
MSGLIDPAFLDKLSTAHKTNRHANTQPFENRIASRLVFHMPTASSLQIWKESMSILGIAKAPAAAVEPSATAWKR